MKNIKSKLLFTKQGRISWVFFSVESAVPINRHLVFLKCGAKIFIYDTNDTLDKCENELHCDDLLLFQKSEPEINQLIGSVSILLSVVDEEIATAFHFINTRGIMGLNETEKVNKTKWAVVLNSENGIEVEGSFMSPKSKLILTLIGDPLVTSVVQPIFDFVDQEIKLGANRIEEIVEKINFSSVRFVK